MPVNQSTMDKFKDFRRAKRQEAADRVGQVVGGTAETLRTGRSAAATFADRDPQLKRDRMKAAFMAKQEAKLGILGDMQKEEQFYYSREQEERHAVLKDIHARLMAEVRVAENDASRAATSAAQAAAGKRLAKTQQAERSLAEEMNLYGMDSGTEALVDSIAGSYGLAPTKEEARAAKSGALAQGYMMQYLKTAGEPGSTKYNEALLSLDDAGLVDDDNNGNYVATGTPGQLKAHLATRFGEEDSQQRRMAEEDAKAYADGALRQQQQVPVDAKTVLQEGMAVLNESEIKTDSDKIEAMHELAGRLHLQPEHIRELVPGYAEIEAGAASERQTAETLVDAQLQAAYEDAGKTYGGDADVPEMGNIYEAYKQAKGIAKENSPLGATADDDEDWGTTIGIPGIQRAGTAQDRMRQTFDLIEQYPEAPAMQTIKQQIMASQDFADFKNQTGYGDDDFAFREMNRMARAQQKSQVRSDKAQRQLRFKQGLSSRKAQTATTTPQPNQAVPQAKPKKHTPASADLVQGTANRVAEE